MVIEIIMAGSVGGPKIKRWYIHSGLLQTHTEVSCPSGQPQAPRQQIPSGSSV